MTEITRKPRYSKMNDIIYPEMFSPKCFKEALEYKPKRGDVFICSYPKCGTTWMQMIVFYIFRKGQELTDFSEFHRLSPYIDLQGQEGIDKMPRPGAFKTHIPFYQMPYSKEAKYIFVARNPKDCCVSMYYHSRDQPGFGFWDGEFNDFFELFMDGKVVFNDYFDHILDWYPYRDDPGVFYTTYEDLKKDSKSVILRLSKFLGKEYIDAIQKDNTVLNNIILYSQFDHMKDKFSKLYTVHKNSYVENMYEGLKYRKEFIESVNPPKNLPGLQFVRKGINGDWKNHLSPEQAERMNRKFIQKLKDTDILHWFPEK